MIDLVANTPKTTTPITSSGAANVQVNPMSDLVSGLVWVAYFVILIIAWWQLFKKAGEEGWKAIIPFYNLYTQIKLTWSTKFFWIMLVLLIMIVGSGGFVYSALYINGVNLPTAMMAWYVSSSLLFFAAGIAIFVFSIIAWYRLAKAYGHGGGYTVGLVFLPFIFILILAFGKSQYQGNVYQKDKSLKSNQ